MALLYENLKTLKREWKISKQGNVWCESRANRMILRHSRGNVWRQLDLTIPTGERRKFGTTIFPVETPLEIVLNFADDYVNYRIHNINTLNGEIADLIVPDGWQEVDLKNPSKREYVIYTNLKNRFRAELRKHSIHIGKLGKWNYRY